MTDAALSLRIYTGTNAGTESAAQTGIDLISADNATNSSGNRAAHEVVPGTASYEKWLRVKLDAANSQSVSNFWVERAGDLPDGVVLKMGVTDTPATPTDTVSTVATTTMADGRRYIFDANTYDTTGEHSRYLVVQEQVALSATPNLPIETENLEIGWSQG